MAWRWLTERNNPGQLRQGAYRRTIQRHQPATAGIQAGASVRLNAPRRDAALTAERTEEGVHTVEEAATQTLPSASQGGLARHHRRRRSPRDLQLAENYARRSRLHCVCVRGRG